MLFSQHPLSPNSVLLLPSLSSSAKPVEKVSATDLWGGGAHVERRLGVERVVWAERAGERWGRCRGGGRRAVCSKCALGRNLAANTVGFWVPMGRKRLPTYSPSSSSASGLGPDKESVPMPLPQLGPFLPGAKDEAGGPFLISTCPSWPTLGTQHPALEQ